MGEIRNCIAICFFFKPAKGDIIELEPIIFIKNYVKSSKASDDDVATKAKEYYIDFKSMTKMVIYLPDD